MFIKYIDRFGNWNEFNEAQQPGWRSRYHQKESGVRYENVAEDKPNSPKQVIEPVKEPTVDTVAEVIEEDYSVYMDYLKSKKIRGCHFLKGENIKTRAIKEGYSN